MNWEQSFTMQAAFDDKVRDEKGLQGVNLKRGRHWAFRTELGELSNELPEYFKFWSNKPNNEEKAKVEFADGLKFAIGIGLDEGIKHTDIKIYPISIPEGLSNKEIIQKLHHDCGWYSYLLENGLYTNLKSMYLELLSTYLLLGTRIGMSGKEMMQAFVDKDKVIHTRIAEGY